MNKWNNEEIQRSIDAHIAEHQLFTSELKETIRAKALQKEQTLRQKHRARPRSLLISSILGVVMTAAALFFVLQVADPPSQVEAPAVTTAGSSEANTLFAELMNKALKGFSAVGANDFDMMKLYFHSDVRLDAVNKTVQFAEDTEPVQTSHFPIADLKDMELLSTFEQTENGMFVMLQANFDSYEIHFQRDPLNGDDYRISAIINAN